MQLGLYEQLINKMVLSQIENLNRENYFIKETRIDKAEAARILSQYLSDVIHYAFSIITGDNSIELQINLANKIIRLLQTELSIQDFDEDLIEIEAKILIAVFNNIDAGFTDFEKHLKHITPYSRLSQSELFTGNNSGISLESEIKKEILSSDNNSVLNKKNKKELE